MLLQILSILSILVAGVGGVLGILYEFRYTEGDRKGQVTRAGKWAVFLLSAGITANIVTTVLNDREKALSRRNEEQQRRIIEEQTHRIALLSLQQRQVRKVQVVIFLGETAENITGDWTLLTSLRSRNGTYLFTFPYETVRRGRALVEPSVYVMEGGRLWRPHVFRIENLRHLIAINLSDMGAENWLLPIFGDLLKVTHSIAVPKTQHEENKIELFNDILRSIEAVAVFFDDFPVHFVRKSQFSPTLVVSDMDNPHLLKVMHTGAKFYEGGLNWTSLSQGADPASVIPKNELTETLRKLGIGPEESYITIEPRSNEPN